MNIEQLRARLAELVADAQSIRDAAAAGKRDLTTDEANNLDGILSEFDTVEASLKRAERLASIEARIEDPTPQPRTVGPEAVAGGTPAGQPRAAAPARAAAQPRNPEERTRWGWQNFGDFCNAVRGAVVNPGAGIDPRLVQAATLTTYGTEGTGADGGFAVPPEWRSAIMTQIEAEDSLLTRTDQQQASGNAITFPNDETTPWQSSGGIQAYWDGEAAAMTQSKPALLPVNLRLHRLTCLVPVTDELLDDAPAMASYVQRKAAEKIGFKINDAIINGDGAGMPLGLMISASAVQASKYSGQAVDTIVGENIPEMWSRMYGPARKNAIWLVNQDVESQLLSATLRVKNAAGSDFVGGGPIYVPPGGFSASPFASLMGRPVVPTESCAALGDVGDIILADLSKYLTVVKTGGLRSDVSIHLWFDQATTAFRFIFRMAGQPWLSAPIARKNGNRTLSHFVYLEAR